MIVCVCVYAPVYIQTHTHMFQHGHVRMLAYLSACLPACLPADLPSCVCWMYVRMYVHMYVYTYLLTCGCVYSVCMYIYICTPTIHTLHMYVHVFVNKYIYTHICILE